MSLIGRLRDIVAGEGYLDDQDVNPVAQEKIRRLRTAASQPQAGGVPPVAGTPRTAIPASAGEQRYFNRTQVEPIQKGYAGVKPPKTGVVVPGRAVQGPETPKISMLRAAAQKANAADVGSHHVGPYLGQIPTPQSAIAGLGQGRPELSQGVTNRNAQAQLVNPLQQEQSVLPVAGAETQQPAAMRQLNPSKIESVGNPAPVATTAPVPPREVQMAPSDALPTVRSNAGDITLGLERSNPAGMTAIEASQQMTVDPGSMPMQTNGGNSRVGGGGSKGLSAAAKEKSRRARKAKQAAARAADKSGWSFFNQPLPDIPKELERRAFHAARRTESAVGRRAILAGGKYGARALRWAPGIGAVAGTGLSLAQGYEEAGVGGAAVQGGADLAGTAIGAGLGTLVAPGIGTAIGATIGGMVGSGVGSGLNAGTADIVAKSKIGAAGPMQWYGQMMDPLIDTPLEKAHMRQQQVKQSAIGRELAARKAADKAERQAEMAEMALLNYTI